MRGIGCSVLLVLMLSSCVGVGYVDEAIRYMERDGLFAEGPAWEDAKRVALDAEVAVREDEYAVIREALAVAGGKHSFLLSSSEIKENKSTEWDVPTVEEQDGIVFITLPCFGGDAEQGKEYTYSVIDKLPASIKGAVIDLRGNTGGNMYPMIAAVHQFLPDDILLKFKSRRRSIPINKSYIMKSMGIEERKTIDCPTAIVVDSLTASSGEAVMICFMGLDGVKSFGTPTAGYASANTPITLSDGAVMVLTTGCDVARDGSIYCDDPIVPDVVTEAPMQEALQWIVEAAEVTLP